MKWAAPLPSHALHLSLTEQNPTSCGFSIEELAKTDQKQVLSYEVVVMFHQ